MSGKPFVTMSPPSAPDPDKEVVTEASLARMGRAVSSCMLDRYAVTTVSVLLGTFLGVRQKNLRPFVSCVTIGTLGDLAYGYFFCCKDLIGDYMEAKKSFDGMKKKPTSPGVGAALNGSTMGAGGLGDGGSIAAGADRRVDIKSPPKPVLGDSVRRD